MGTSHCRQPFQCAINNIRQTRLKIRMNLLATVRNYTDMKNIQRGTVPAPVWLFNVYANI